MSTSKCFKFAEKGCASGMLLHYYPVVHLVFLLCRRQVNIFSYSESGKIYLQQNHQQQCLYRPLSHWHNHIKNLLLLRNFVHHLPQIFYILYVFAADVPVLDHCHILRSSSESNSDLARGRGVVELRRTFWDDSSIVRLHAAYCYFSWMIFSRLSFLV